jgi:hypothetical protein
MQIFEIGGSVGFIGTVEIRGVRKGIEGRFTGFELVQEFWERLPTVLVLFANGVIPATSMALNWSWSLLFPAGSA